MTTNNPGPVRNRRGRTILIVAAAVVVGLLAGLIVVGIARHKSTGGQATPTTALTAAPSSAPASSAVGSPAVSTPNSVDGVSGSLADGCLGGANAFTAVLAAQKAATPDNNGAAAFARTVARWAASYPSDPNTAAVLAKLQAPGTAFAEVALLQTQKADADLQSQGYVSGQVMPNLGQYRVVNGVTGGGQPGATVQVQMYRELTNTSGQTSQTELTTELVLRLVNNVWTVVGSPPNPEEVPTTAVPWLSFDRAC